MTNNLIDFYKYVKNDNQKLDKNFKQHYILPASHILCIGGSGCGKSTALLNFIAKKHSFYEIIIYAPTSDPLYDLLCEKIPDIELFTNIEELPSLSEIEDNKHEKLIVFDDFITLNSKQMRKIKEYLVAGRKKQCSCFLMSQNYVSVPKDISRNINYFIIFKLNDNISINTIVKNHSIDDVSVETVKNAYRNCTTEPKNFMLIDLRTTDESKRFRHNFTSFLDLKK